ncbi:MAG: PqqD family protein [Ruminococcus sp.]|nr:PqqD family protein [Ruminococcus sp.]
MKLKSEFVIRKFSDKWIALPVEDSDDKADNNNVFISMSSTAAYVFELLQNEINYDEIINKIVEKYAVDKATAKADLDEFLNSVRKAGLLYE